MDKISYALGLSIGHNFRATGIKKLELEDFMRALKAVLEEEPAEISIAEAQTIMNSYLESLRADKLKNNKEAGEEFLKINAQRKGVECFENGIQYMILKRGEGSKPKLTDSVKCHYEGSLINGTVFDSSVKRGQPAVFPLSGVIKGWTYTLQQMPVGSKWRVFIPAHLAYGEQGAGELIEPNSTLIFDIELLDIV